MFEKQTTASKIKSYICKKQGQTFQTLHQINTTWTFWIIKGNQWKLCFFSGCDWLIMSQESSVTFAAIIFPYFTFFTFVLFQKHKKCYQPYTFILLDLD